MTDDFPYDRILRESLQGELKIVNTHLPVQPKPLSELLTEDYPQVLCRDGTTHLFHRRELNYLAGLIDSAEQKELTLPILIEVSSGDDEMAVLGTGGVVGKVIGRLLDMPLTVKRNRIIIHKPQLALIRQKLRTSTQYIFAPRINSLI